MMPENLKDGNMFFTDHSATLYAAALFGAIIFFSFAIIFLHMILTAIGYEHYVKLSYTDKV